MARYLIDTSILIDLLRKYAPARQWLDNLPTEDWTISFITSAELLAGCRNKREQQAIVNELSQYHVLWLTELAQQRALDSFTQLHLSHSVGFLDCMIAAIAVENGLVLATVNDKHFRAIQGLTVERPY
jgi:predicted nucleic acid-binding protein